MCRLPILAADCLASEAVVFVSGVSCLYFEPLSATWSAASIGCVARGGTLATLASSTEATLFTTLVGTSAPVVTLWVGLSSRVYAYPVPGGSSLQPVRDTRSTACTQEQQTCVRMPHVCVDTQCVTALLQAGYLPWAASGAHTARAAAPAAVCVQSTSAGWVDADCAAATAFGACAVPVALPRVLVEPTPGERFVHSSSPWVMDVHGTFTTGQTYSVAVRTHSGAELASYAAVVVRGSAAGSEWVTTLRRSHCVHYAGRGALQAVLPSKLSLTWSTSLEAVPGATLFAVVKDPAAPGFAWVEAPVGTVAGGELAL